ncbi:phage portal protein [Shouchella clausii]|uniref:phage portal protein n=1 Tax=Shouchella clausii TaxID=79880 RepID=UPI00289E1D84|nr:phage portal protein [Shouchella clausii]
MTTLHPEVAAIVSFLHARFPSKLYTRELDQNFVTPSLYIPPAISFSGVDTVSTYQKTYTLNLKLFHDNQQLAVQTAESLHDALQGARMQLPMVDQYGVATNNYVRISRIDVRPGDGATAVMVFAWTSRYYYDRPEYIPLQSVTMKGGLK